MGRRRTTQALKPLQKEMDTETMKVLLLYLAFTHPRLEKHFLLVVD